MSRRDPSSFTEHPMMLGGIPASHMHYPVMNEEANDDGSDEAESARPSPNGNFWSFDAPGGHNGVLSVDRNNFCEFLRVSFSGPSPSGDVWIGSRCSPVQEWYSKGTHGFVTVPTAIAAGDFTFTSEALHTEVAVATTVPGTAHQAILRGLDTASAAGGGAENVDLDLIDDDGATADILDSVVAPEFGKSADTEVGDQTAYTGTAEYGAKASAEVYGPDGASGETTAEVAHEVDVGGGNPRSAATAVAGTVWTPPPAEPF